jgi:hypothetical protein
MLPDVGLSILSTLRNVGKQTPLLILSALSVVDQRVRGLRAIGAERGRPRPRYEQSSRGACGRSA